MRRKDRPRLRLSFWTFDLESEARRSAKPLVLAQLRSTNWRSLTVDLLKHFLQIPPVSGNHFATQCRQLNQTIALKSKIASTCRSRRTIRGSLLLPTTFA